MLAFFCEFYHRKVAQANDIVIFLEASGDRPLDFVLGIDEAAFV